jgi:hypothetical protein
MSLVKMSASVTAIGLLALLLAIAPRPAEAHCDTMNGPVVGAARTALNTGSLLPVLQWVRKEDEDEIEEAFLKVLKARKGGPEAKEVAERYFFEKVVRVHRAAEGEPFTGLKPAAEPEPGVAEADEALLTGNVEALATALGEAVAASVRERFARASERKAQGERSVEAGRAYVAAYVEFVHYVETLHHLASGQAHAHGAVAQAAPQHAHVH